MQKQLKVLWHSNAPYVGTGYGSQTKLTIEAMQADGHEVVVSAFYGLAGAPLNMNGVEMTGTAKDTYGNDMIEAHQKFYKPDVTIGLLDIWVMRNEVLSKLENYWHWLPIDHSPTPPDVLTGVKAINNKAIAMSKFGAKQLTDAGITGHKYIPHAVDTNILKPMARADARKAMQMPDDMFIVGIIMANKGTPSRKAFDQNIRAYAMFQRSHKNAMLYLHTDVVGWHGEDLLRIIELAEERYQIKLNYKVVSPYHYQNGRITYAEMGYVYNTCNVVLNASRGEGFGVPIIEAQACGTPVIVTDFSAMPELVVDGHKVGYSDLWFTVQNSYQVTPDVNQIFEALVRESMTGFDDMERRMTTASAIKEQYDIQNVYKTFWQPFLSEVAQNE